MSRFGSAKVGGPALIIGAVLSIAGNALHPRGPGGLVGVASRDAEAQLVTENLGTWYPSHGALILGLPLLLLGYLTLYGVLAEREQRGYSSAAIVALGLGLLLLIGAVVLDGFVTPVLAQSYVVAPAQVREVAGAILDYNFGVSLTILAIAFLSLTAGLGLLGAALAKARLYSRGLAWAGVAIGLVGVLGYVGGLFGPYWVFSPAFAPFAIIFTLWGLVVGVFLYRGR
jgi:hypothetical protein